MNRKLLKRPIMFMVMGVPGAGKSWFSRNIAQQFSAVHVDSERIRYELFEEQSYSEDEDIVTENITDYFTHTTLISGNCVMVDGSCNTKSRRNTLKKLAKEYNYLTVLVWVQSNDDLSKMRSGSKSNETVESYKRKLTAEQYSSLADELQRPTEKENPIVVSGSYSSKAQLKAVITRLNDLDVLALGATSGSRHSKKVI